MYTDLHFINIILPVVANIVKALLHFADILRCQIQVSTKRACYLRGIRVN